MNFFCPFTPRSPSGFSKMNVPWLQLSNNAYVFTVFPELLYLRLTGTTHMLIIVPHVFTVAHFISPPFDVSILSFF